MPVVDRLQRNDKPPWQEKVALLLFLAPVSSLWVQVKVTPPLPLPPPHSAAKSTRKWSRPPGSVRLRVGWGGGCCSFQREGGRSYRTPHTARPLSSFLPHLQKESKSWREAGRLLFPRHSLYLFISWVDLWPLLSFKEIQQHMPCDSYCVWLHDTSVGLSGLLYIIYLVV